MNSIEKLNIEKFNVPSVSIKHINSLEEILGNKLPNSYKELLLVYNGGVPNVNVFRNGDREFLFSHFFFLENPQKATNNKDKNLGILSEYKAMMTELPKNFLPIAAEPTGDVFVMDTSFAEKAPIYIWLHDSDEQLIKLADDFDEFLSKLEHEVEYD